MHTQTLMHIYVFSNPAAFQFPVLYSLWWRISICCSTLWSHSKANIISHFYNLVQNTRLDFYCTCCTEDQGPVICSVECVFIFRWENQCQFDSQTPSTINIHPTYLLSHYFSYQRSVRTLLREIDTVLIQQLTENKNRKNTNLKVKWP